MAFTTHPNIAPRLKKEYSYTSTPHMGFRGLFYGVLYDFYRILTQGLFVFKKVRLDATVCRHLFTAKSLYMLRVSQHPSSGVLKTVSATSGIGHDIGTATSFHRGLIRPRWNEVAVPVS